MKSDGFYNRQNAKADGHALVPFFINPPSSNRRRQIRVCKRDSKNNV